MRCSELSKAWDQQTPVPGSARPCIRHCRKRAVEVPAPPPPVLASRSIPATTGCRTLTGPLVLLCHNPPQESGSTSPFNLSQRTNPMNGTLARASVNSPSCSSTIHLLNGPGLEQRRLTAASNIHRAKEKAMALPPSLTCAELEEIGRTETGNLVPRLIDHLVLGDPGHRGQASIKRGPGLSFRD